MDFMSLLENRYATKHYDKDAVIDADVIQKILDCAVLTPSAVNMQPWAFYLIKGESQKAQLAPAIKDFNLQRYNDSAVAIVIAAKTALNAQDVLAVCEQEKIDGRYENDLAFKDRYQHMLKAVDGHNAKGDMQEWCAKQSYIALGTILYAAASYGLDCTALEGVDQDMIDKLLDLKQDNLHAQLVVLLGKASKQDSNALALRPKSRFNTVREAHFVKA